MHHISGVKNACADYITRNNGDDLIGTKLEELAKAAFPRLDVHRDLNMTMITPLHGLKQAEYLKEFWDTSKRLQKQPNPSWATRSSGNETKTTSGMRTAS